MKFLDKKFLIIFLLFIIICALIYILKQSNDEDIISTDEFYITSTSNTTEEESINIIVHIHGEILNPGLVYLPIDSRISDAISAAGGITEIADLSKVNLAYKLKDAQKIYIPSIYDEEQEIYIQEDAGANVVIPDSSPPSLLININTAIQPELETLPGIGASTAKKIIDYRLTNGNFKKIEDIMNVPGIGESKFNSIKDQICI